MLKETLWGLWGLWGLLWGLWCVLVSPQVSLGRRNPIETEAMPTPLIR